MSARPILFSASMVRALLAGRKTQTRRVLRPLRRFPEHQQLRTDVLDGALWWWNGVHDRVGVSAPLPYAPGDRLWVKEAWRAGARADTLKPSELSPVFWRHQNGGLWYEADGAEPAHPITPKGRYRHARFMPRWASRLTLTVTEVRVQRLQEISGEDCESEGLVPYPMEGPGGMAATGWHWLEGKDPEQTFTAARLAYRALWNTLHGPGAWDANPWVAAYTFTVERGNVDEVAVP